MITRQTNSIIRLIILCFLAVALFPFTSSSQCIQKVRLDRSVSFAGISADIDQYYRNLIIQDIALAGRKTFQEIKLDIEFRVNYESDLCRTGQLEVRLFPLKLSCSPVLYQGYDISSAVKPEKADVVFHLLHKDGFVTDSLAFYDISLEKDSNYYTSLTVERTDPASLAAVSFSDAVLKFTPSSYDIFRDRILEIDHYYAAAFIADSALAWTTHGFLAETDDFTEMKIRQTELERIIHYIRPGQFEIIAGITAPDLAGLQEKYRALIRLNNRYKAIISYNISDRKAGNGFVPAGKLIEQTLSRLDDYYKLAYNTDFKYVSFIQGLAMISFSSASLADMHRRFTGTSSNGYYSARKFSGAVAEQLIRRADLFAAEGNDLRALSYYDAVLDLANHMHLPEYESMAGKLAEKTKNDLASSYIEISRKAILTENPAMATQYFREALLIITNGNMDMTGLQSFRDHEMWMMAEIENQMAQNLGKGNYSQAMLYLNEIQSHCLEFTSYPCPDRFHEWMKTARTGIYKNLLVRSRSLFNADEIAEAEQLYKQALELRARGGYRIDRDPEEAGLEVDFRQIRYDELFEEGMIYYHREQYPTALYYFNEASFLEKFSLSKLRPDLGTYRQDAARQIILQSLSEGRVSLWAHDFQGAESMLSLVKTMLTDYRFSQNDSLFTQYISLKEKILSGECEKIRAGYADLMSQSDQAISGQDFILALEFADKAVSLSLAHLDCGIDDSEAWYRKVNLEAPAEYQEMEKALEQLVTVTSSGYIESFQALKTFYNRNRLLEQNLIFLPLIDRVLQENDPGFLKEMIKYYMGQRDYDRALLVLKRINELGMDSSPVAKEQQNLAFALARRDYARSPEEKPWEIMNSYTGGNKWFRKFAWKYKMTWLKEAGWKLKYWPILLKK